MPAKHALALICAATAVALAACGPEFDQLESITASVGAPQGLATAGKLTVAVPVALPPYGFRGTRGEPEGFAVDLARQMAMRMGIGVRVVPFDANALAGTVRAGDVDVVIGTAALARTSRPPSGFTLLPYIRGGSELMIKADSPYQPHDLSELCGHRVAVVNGTPQETALSDAATQCGSGPPRVQSVLGDDDALSALRSGAAEVYLAESATVAYDVAKHPDLQPSSGELDSTELAIALRATPPMVEDALARAYYTVRADGWYEQIVKTWGLTADSL